MTGESPNCRRSERPGRPAEGADARSPTSRRRRLPDVSFAVRRGEVVGISGATSSGRIGVAEAVAGLGPPGRGDPDRRRPAAAPRRAGALALGRLRAEEPSRPGLVMSQSVGDNTTMTIADRLGRRRLHRPRRKAVAANAVDPRPRRGHRGPDQLVSALSGGNQQKVVMGRALANDPSVLVLMDPTAGVDVKSKEALLAVVERMRREGKAILVVSGELEDLRTCDRVLVMRHGAHRGGAQGGLERQRPRRLDRRNLSNMTVDPAQHCPRATSQAPRRPEAIGDRAAAGPRAPAGAGAALVIGAASSARSS